MQADNRRPDLQQQGQHLGIVGETFIDGGQPARRGHAEFGKDRRQPVEPGCFTGWIGGRRGVDEEIDVEGADGARLHLHDHRARPGRIRGADADRAEPAGIRDRSRHGRRRNARHRGLHDRQCHSKPVQHGACSSAELPCLCIAPLPSWCNCCFKPGFASGRSVNPRWRQAATAPGRGRAPAGSAARSAPARRCRAARRQSAR